jgi:integrase
MSDRKRYKTKYPGVAYRLKTDGTRQHMIWYVGTDGKPRWENVEGGLGDAHRARCKIVDRIAHGHKIAPTRTLFAQFAREWLEEQINLRPNSVAAYQYAIEKHLIPRLGVRTQLRDVDVGLVAAMIGDMRAEGLKGNTIRQVLKPLSRIMKTAVRRGLVTTNPVELLERCERPQSDQATMNILDSNEIVLVLNNATDHWRPLLTTAIFTGLRVSELLDLRWDDVDWEAGVVRVNDSKTPAARREVVLMDSLQQMLAARSLEPNLSGYVFESTTGKRMDRKGPGKYGLKPALKRAGITKRVRFHDLRHTFASILIAAGNDPLYVAEQLGHTNASFTLRTYGHLMDRDDRRRVAREKMQSAFGQVLGK